MDSFFIHSAAAQRLFRLWGEVGDWTALLHTLRQIQEDELLQGKAEHVRVLTLHAAKGLEFRAVFIPALEDGLLPLRHASFSPHKTQDDATAEESIAEAQRLCYVGMTRAADILFLSHAEQRLVYARPVHLPPSPLLARVRPLCHTLRIQHKAQRTEQQLLLL